MARFYYSATTPDFLRDDENRILGILLSHFGNQNLTNQARNAWQEQIRLLKDSLRELNEGQIYFEFAIPRMGKRADNILIVRDAVCVIEFKIGARHFKPYVDQVLDYSLDLKNFHKGSHAARIYPILVCTAAERLDNELIAYPDGVFRPLFSNAENLAAVLQLVMENQEAETLSVQDWEDSLYLPTPTIIEAAQALYSEQTVEDITRHEAGAKNLAETSRCIERAIDHADTSGSKCICFVTGVPGAGKTLAGLNIATSFLSSEGDQSVFLSGNGPLVDVLREALARNRVANALERGEPETLSDARRRTKAFLLNVHQWRDYYLEHPKALPDRVVVFDEAQRAWTREQLNDFMHRKRGRPDFNMSEPHFLVDVMNRHAGSATIVCLVGGGQEINRGEAGLSEWVRALRDYYSDWDMYVSNEIVAQDLYIDDEELRQWIYAKALIESDLHLSVPVRSFRSENLAQFVEAVLELDITSAQQLLAQLYEDGYPIVLTRDLEKAKLWLRRNSRGNERCGLVASAGAHRLRPLGISVREDIDAPIWFLNGKEDVRSSFFLEEVATEFSIQGLELDWTCVCWDGDMFLRNTEWELRRFRGTRWERHNDPLARRYLVNAYRVILTRARQGMVILVPFGDENDQTRRPEFYDGTFRYLENLGLRVL
jgi:hypothetical protein